MRQRVSSGSSFERDYGYCRALRVGNRVVVAGTAPIPSDGEAVAASPHDQMLRCGEIAFAAMREAGAEPHHAVRSTMYIVDAADQDAVGTAHRKLFGPDGPPATMIVVAALLDPAWKVELEIDAVIDD